jgi:hypothetical protein
MRPILTALLLLAAPSLVVAQNADTPPAPTQQDPQAAYDELVKAFNKAISDWQTETEAAVLKAKADGERAPKQTPPPTKQFISTAAELAARHAGKDDAVRFLAFIVKNATQERNAVKKAVETLASAHATSPMIGDVLPFLPNATRFGATQHVMALLDGVAANHADVECKATALLTRGTLRLQGASTDAERKAAEKDLRDVAGLSKDEDLLAQAKDALFEIEHLQVGCTAPDIVGVDVEGVPMKLSDHRGKVVLLDFWGFW